MRYRKFGLILNKRNVISIDVLSLDRRIVHLLLDRRFPKKKKNHSKRRLLVDTPSTVALYQQHASFIIDRSKIIIKGCIYIYFDGDSSLVYVCLSALRIFPSLIFFENVPIKWKCGRCCCCCWCYCCCCCGKLIATQHCEQVFIFSWL